MKKMSRKEKIICTLLVVFSLLMTFPVLAFQSDNIVFSIVAGSLLAVVGFFGYVFLKQALLPALLVSGVPLAIALLISFLFFAEIGVEIFILSLVVAIPVFSFLFIFTVLGSWIAMLVYKMRAAKVVECLPEESEQNSQADVAKSDSNTDSTEEERVGKDKSNPRINIIIYTAFALTLIISTFLTFLFNIEVAYQPDIYPVIIMPAYFEIFYYGVGISLIFCFIAIGIRVIFAALFKKINIWILLVLALLIPLNQIGINRDLFDEEGPLYSTVQKGGMLFFAVTRDFDLDGEYDEKYRLIYDEREVTVNYEDGTNNKDKKTEIDHIEVRIIGKGTKLDDSRAYIYQSSFDKSISRQIRVSSGYNTTVESVEIYVTPRRNKDPQKFEFAGVDIDVTSEVLDDGRIKLTVDPEEISRREKESERHSMSFDINFDYKE